MTIVEPPAAEDETPDAEASPAPNVAAETGTAAGRGDDPLGPLGQGFRAAMVAMRRLRGRETQRSGELSFAQYSLLFGLAEADELSARELALKAELSPATVTQMLDSLESHGLVRRTRSARDKRVVLTNLTERGQELVDARRARFEAKWREALVDFSADELRTAGAVLSRLAEMFDGIGRDES